jgi:hypothetical protein
MKTLLIILVGVIIPCVVISQSQEKLSKIQAPSSPAAGILGLQPTVVLSPKSYEALETALFSSMQSSNSGFAIPTDFALEFTPYWAVDHSLPIDEYLYPEKVFKDQILRNSSISIASTQSFLLGDSTETNGLAFGYRTTVYIGGKSDREVIESLMVAVRQNDDVTTEASSKLNEYLYGIVKDEQVQIKRNDIFLFVADGIRSTLIDDELNSNDIDSFINQFKNKVESTLPESISNDDAEKDSFHDDFIAILEGLIDSEHNFLMLEKYIQNRQGFSIDFAYAALLNFPTNNFQIGYVPKQSFYLTPTYTKSINMAKESPWSLKFAGVVRYEWYNLGYYEQYFEDNQVYTRNWDYGFAVAAEFNKFSLQFELVGRNSFSKIPEGENDNGDKLYRDESNSEVQYIGTFNYNISKQVVLSYNLGNRFDPILNPDNTLVSTLTLNLGFGSPTEQEIDLLKTP